MAHKDNFYEKINGNMEISLKIDSASSDSSPRTKLSKVIVVRGIKTDKISFPFNYARENERRENLLANLGPEPIPSSEDHVE
jgi:hypothetical protein